MSADALLRLELLLGETCGKPRAVSDIVSQDGGLKTHVLQLAHDTVPCDEDEVTRRTNASWRSASNGSASPSGKPASG